MTTSPQMVNLMRRYRVTSQAALVRAIRDEYTAETCEPGERPVSLATAEVILDRMLEAEYQRIAGGAYTPLVPDEERGGRTDPRDPIEIYGTFEHEQHLIELERQEG